MRRSRLRIFGSRSVPAVLALLAMATPAAAGLEQPIYIIDSPTAGLLGHGEYRIQGRIGPESSILLGLRVGLKQVVHLGISFGMQRVFERADISVNDKVGVQARLRLLQEGAGPALALGFNNQGVGRYDEDLERYERKSKGFYGVVSKNWKVIVGQLSLHGGVNYSTETRDEKSVNLFAGGDWEIVPGLAILVDWDAGLDDREENGVYGRGRSYLDAAVRVTYGANLSMMLTFRDLTGNYEPSKHVWREFEIAFVDVF